MARIRTIKPEFPHSGTLGKVPLEARYLFILLWTICDDEGRCRGDPRLLSGLLFPYDRDMDNRIAEWLANLVEVKAISYYEVESERYIEVTKWKDHQRIDKPTKSKFPGPDDEQARNVARAREESREVARVPGILKPKKAKEETPEWFEEFRQIYPKRAGDQGWTKALKAANARLREGHTVEEFLEGARNYAIYCRGTGKVGTEYVKQAATFLGPDKPFLVPHSLPKTKAEVQQDENIAAANAWLATQDLGESEEVIQ